MGFRWTERGIEELTVRTLEGESVVRIAVELGCEPRTARKMQIELELVAAVKRRHWTKRELATVRRLYADVSTKEIAKKLPGRAVTTVYQQAAKMGLRKSAKYLAGPEACRLRRGDNVGAAYRFKPGQTPTNKGLRRPGWAPGRMAETQFKKGCRAGKAIENWCPIGTIRPDAEGFLRIKVREGTKGEAYGFGNTKIWPLLNRHAWEQHKGPIPPSSAVVFKDGDRSNCAIDNLECISRAELMRRNTIHNYPTELKHTIMLLGAVKRKVRENAEKHNDGSAQPSV